MDWSRLALLDHPFRLWITAGAVLLAVEVATGTGWLLPAAACAGLLAFVMLAPVPLDLGAQVAAFAVLTIVATFVARRFLPRRAHGGHDLNDVSARLAGQAGVAATAFVHGHGRVRVGGAEWDAECDPGRRGRQHRGRGRAGRDPSGRAAGSRLTPLRHNGAPGLSPVESRAEFASCSRWRGRCEGAMTLAFFA